jgi:hypothetical protein
MSLLQDKAKDEAVLRASEKHCMSLSGQPLFDEVKNGLGFRV